MENVGAFHGDHNNPSPTTESLEQANNNHNNIVILSRHQS